MNIYLQNLASIQKRTSPIKFAPPHLAEESENSSVSNLSTKASGAESKAVCTEAGMFALRERRQHVTQEDFEMSVSKVMKKDGENNMSVKQLFK